jgi:hypothetical protein
MHLSNLHSLSNTRAAGISFSAIERVMPARYDLPGEHFERASLLSRAGTPNEGLALFFYEC